MTTSMLSRLSSLFVLVCMTAVVHARDVDIAVKPVATVAGDTGASDEDSSDEDRTESDWIERHHHRTHRHGSHGGDRVNIAHNTFLASGEHADSVVSILGSSTSEGEAADVVSVLGSTRVTGPVSDNAVAVLGNNYVDSKVDGDVVAVLGSVELGPHAEVGGDVIAVLGSVHRDPAAIVHGDVQGIFSESFGGAQWLHVWIDKCLLRARPLAFAPGLQWAWTIALVMLAFYAFLASLFRSGVEECVRTLNTQPGHTALAALLTMLLTPVLIVVLCITVVGIAAVPFVVLALFCISLFGKAVMLAWMGERIIHRRPGGAGHPAVAVLIGGVIALALYVVPVLGFLAYKILGFFGLGAVVYTLILAARARRAGGQTPPPISPQPNYTNYAAGAAAPTAAAAGPAPGAAPGAAPDATAADLGGLGAAGAGAADAATPHAAFVVPPALASMPRAGFWVRMAALLLDVLLVGIVMGLLGSFGHLHLLALAIYGAVMWKLRGATVGGIVFDLQVVRLDGRAVDWETVIIRALGCFLSLAIVGLGFIWIAFDDAHQAWHDKIAGTVVVRVRRG